MKILSSPIGRSIRKVLNSERGQALVETSFSTSFILILILGAADLARMSYIAIEVANAAKAAVQYGAQNTASASNTASIQAAAASDAADLSGLNTTVSVGGMCSNGNSCTGTGGSCLATDCSTSHIEVVLTVSTSATYSPMIHGLGLPSTFTMHGHAIQKVLNY